MLSLYLVLCSLLSVLLTGFWYLSPLIDTEFYRLTRDIVGGSHLTCPEKPSRVLQVTRPFAVRPSAVLALKREGLQRVRLSRVVVGGNSCGFVGQKSQILVPFPTTSLLR